MSYARKALLSILRCCSCQCQRDDRLVRIHVGDGRHADARRLDDVDGVDADAWAIWPGAAAMFLGMWVVMMVAMMLPSLVPMLWCYREGSAHRGPERAPRRGWLTTLVGVGYFFVWTVIGAVVFRARRCAGGD